MSEPVPELLAVKYENCVLRLQVLQQQAAAIQAEQRAILSEMHAAVGVGDAALYDPRTRTFAEGLRP